MSDSIYRIPHHDEAELATLGALLIDNEAMSIVSKLLCPEDFHSAANRYIYIAMQTLFRRKEDIDLITLANELRSMAAIDTAGSGLAYISRLTSAAPTSANVEYYARIVQAASIRRRLIDISKEIIERANDDSTEVREIIAEAKNRLDKVIIE